MTTTTAYVIHPPRRATSGAQGGAVRTFGRKANNSQQPPELPEDTRQMFEKISDPKNAHHFSVEALREGLAHIKL